jgi:hypothetical protein
MGRQAGRQDRLAGGAADAQQMGLVFYRRPFEFQRRTACPETELWDYVIVHELLHFSVPNHGKLWKSLMRSHLGEYEAHEGELKRIAGNKARQFDSDRRHHIYKGLGRGQALFSFTPSSLAGVTTLGDAANAARSPTPQARRSHV